MIYKGIDVSSYQGTIDWNKVVKQGWKFAILKVIRKDLGADKQFENNWNGCLNANMPIQGVYNYSYATTTNKAKIDAQTVVNILGTNRHPMVWLDVEDNCQKGLGTLLIDIILAYRKVIVENGMNFGVYTGKSFYETYIKKYESKLENVPFWIARYPSNLTMKFSKNASVSYKPSINLPLYGWQYSSKGIVSGISGSVDINEWYVDIEAKNSTKNNVVSQSDFITNVKNILGIGYTATSTQALNKTITISTNVNKTHKAVTQLERHFKELGYYNGTIEEDLGKIPSFGNGMKKATILYQANVVKAIKKNQDGEITKKGATWKSLLKIS